MSAKGTSGASHASLQLNCKYFIIMELLSCVKNFCGANVIARLR
jgi:hypothetical protein